MPEYSVIGKRLPRVDAKDKVTGRAKYTADLELPGMLWGKLVRSSYPHARILNIDTRQAERLPGVKAVTTGKDFGSYKRGWNQDEEPLAVERVRYIGEGIAAVAAIDEDTAEEAAKLVKVDYEELPGCFDVFEAMKDGAPLVHDNCPNNICFELHWHFGDVDMAFEESYLVREDRFKIPNVAGGYIEPSAILANWDASDKVTVWASEALPHFLWMTIVDLYKLPMNHVRVIQPIHGANFGGSKAGNMDNCNWAAVMLAKNAGKPVKIVQTMEEQLAVALRRHKMYIDIKTGVNRDGLLQAIQTKVVADGGAYSALSPLVLHYTGAQMGLPYELPNFKTDMYCVFTNTPSSSVHRGMGVFESRFAADVQMDMIADELGIDPLEMRLRNAIDPPKPGSIYETINQLHVATCGIKECLEKTAKAVDWKERIGAKKVDGNIAWGMGIAASAFPSGVKHGGHSSCAAIIRICEDGSVNLLTGATDVGQGSDTIICQIAAEVLGIALEDIEIRRVDSAVTPVDPGSFGSRVTVFAGQATQRAAEDAKRQLLEFAAKQFGAKPQDIDSKDKKVFVKTNAEKSMPWLDLVRMACYSTSGAVIIGRGYSTSDIIIAHESIELFTKGTGDLGVNYSFATQESEVEVDMETGVVSCVDSTIAKDAGRPLNPNSVETQSIGGSLQGLGEALYEDFIMDNGKTLNPTFLDYKKPTSYDAPMTKVIHVITDDPNGPFGAKEAAEATMTTAAPSIISALHDATGIWIKELPATPEKVWKALKEKPRK